MPVRFRAVHLGAGRHPLEGRGPATALPVVSSVRPALLALGDTRAAELGDHRVPLEWKHTCEEVDWDELSALYLAAPLGNKSPAHLRTVFPNSRYTCFVYEDGRLVGVGRALADGADCSYICDIAVLPSHQGTGLGKQIVGSPIQAWRQRLMYKYEVIIYWSEEDRVFIAEVPELPGCAAHGNSPDSALGNSQDAIELWLDTAREFGRPVPEPKGRPLQLA